MTVLENLFLYYNQLPLNDSKRDILRHLMPHIKEIDQMTIYDVAECCYTSTATISRLVRAMGFKNYTIFQSKLHESVSRYDYDNRFTQNSRNSSLSAKDLVSSEMDFMLTEFRKHANNDQIDLLADAIHTSSYVALFAYGLRFMENALQSDIVYSGIPCDIALSETEQLSLAEQLKPGHLAIFMCPDAIDSISFTGKLIRLTHEKGPKIAILSSTGQQAFVSLSDILFTFNGHRCQSDSFYLEMLLAAITITYRKKYID